MALKALNSVGGFSVGESPNVVIASNGDFSGNKANFVGNVSVLGVLTDNYYFANGAPLDFQRPDGANTQIQFNDDNDFGASANFTFNSDTNVLTVTGNIVVADTANVGNLRTDNLLYANGEPYDLQEAAGANNQIQFNIGNDFAASGNLTYNDSTQQFTVLGNAQFNNANLGNLMQANFAEITSNVIANNITSNSLLTANVANFSGNATFAGDQVTIDNELSGNTANFSGNITADTFIGNIEGNVTTQAPDTAILYSDEGAAVGSNNFTWNDATDSLTVSGTATVTGNAQVGGILTDNYFFANGAPLDFQRPAGANTQLQFNDDEDFGASANLTFDSDTDTLTTVTANVTTLNATDVDVSNDFAVSGNASFSGDQVSIANDLQANTATFSGNISTQNADLGNLATANFVDVSSNVVTENLTVNSALSGDTATFTGNLESLNADLGNLATANFVNVANDLNVVGNVNGGNLVGTLANGTSNVRIFNNANVELSASGTANVVRISDSSVHVSEDFTVTGGNILANGNITANSSAFVGASAELTGEANVGSVLTANVTAPTGNLNFNAAGTNSSILLTPTGTGTVDVNNFRISEVATPINPLDATNKQYVDALAGEGLVIHDPVRLEAETELNATYAQGGTTPTVVSIANGSEITFGSAHGLSLNDGIVFDNSFNGLDGGEAYWVASIVDSTTITVKDDITGATVTGLTNGTGLTEGSRANPGVGATLTNAGANAALVIDGVTVSTNDRVLVYEQTNGEENGIYTVTTVGDGSTAWVLTRASDFNKYIPSSSQGVARNSYVLVQEGDSGAGESYVMTDPTGEIIIGTDALTFTQFTAASVYTGEDGIEVDGTIITANVDGTTTAIVGGNIAVKASAQLTTPNIGAATGTSLNVTGNVDANNVSVGNIANVGLDLVVGGNADVDGTISSNANVSGLNFSTSGNLQASGDVVADNVTANTLLSAPTANVSNAVNAGNVNIDDDLQGNTATFSGNVTVPNLAVNLELSGNTANFTEVTVAQGLNGNTATFSGNIDSLNADLGNLATANFFTGTLIDGTSNLVIAPSGNITITASGNSSFVVTDTGANVAGNLDITGDLSVDTVTANSYTANDDVKIGDTEIGHGTLTTSAITANQTIAEFELTGTTGAEFIVKGEDSTGAKYSVATVTAVTDGSNVDFVTFATAQLGGPTGTLAVNVVGSNVALQVTPASSNSTVWTAQFRTI